ncbi:MAG: NAD(P)H-hydrate dehydratase [Synergistaceae bacterium]|nr:NAD(P)H-hydrate dehydratase [Synergistaceae bacterium]
MIKYYKSSDIREADRIATEQFGIPGFALMENAGRGAAEALMERYLEAHNILILCGPGNNGGDGFVAARRLALAGRAPTVVATINVGEYKNDAAIAANTFVSMTASSAAAFLKSKARIYYSANLTDDELSDLVRPSDLTVDALLGTGSSGVPRGEVKRLVELCGEAQRVISLDIPSGINPDTGEAAETAVNAELTLTFLAPKTGLAVSPGSLNSGEVRVCDIGIPPELVLSAHELTGYDKSDIPFMTPGIPKDAHKGTRGALMIVGGCNFYRGAPVLAAMGALKAGCGLVYLAIPDFMVSGASALLPEAIFIPLESKNGSIDYESFERSASPWLAKCGALVCGPGIGLAEGARKATEWLCRAWGKPLLLDADALRHTADIRRNGSFCRIPNSTVITPHEGEAAYMLGKDAVKISRERLTSCVELANEFGVTLLKGFHTLICNGEEKRVILEGGPQLAVPGSGDVLSGIIGAFLAAGMPPMDAATLGALTHAQAGDKYEGVSGLLARELAGKIIVGS